MCRSTRWPRASLDAYDLDDWSIEVTPTLAAQVSVLPMHKLVRISATLAIGRQSKDRLLLHEVGTHVLRSANAQSQPTPLAEFQFHHSAATEEGLAFWHEEVYGLGSPRITRRYAARALAVAMSRSSGIMEIIARLEPHIGLADAIDVAIRVKRGLLDPDQAGGLTKDHAYLSGVIAVTATLNETPERYPAVMATKWPLHLLSTVERLIADGIFQLPVYLPTPARFRPS